MLALVVIGLSTVTLIVGTFIPILTAALTKYQAPARVKAIVSIVLVVIAALLTAAIQDGGNAVLTWDTLREGVIMFITQLAAYLGLWNPVTQINSKMAPNHGLD